MRKSILLFLTALLAASPLTAQTGNREITASAAETYAEKQSAYTPSFRIDGKNARICNVILLIGDGMGQGAVNLGMYANGGELTMTNLKTMGYVRTQSANNFTTDSAASGTAYATGVKTKNGYLGKDSSKVNIPNIPELLAPLGYACGVVSTDDLNGATPAAFFAHQASRNAKEEIWADLPASQLTFASAGTQSVFESMPLSTQEAIKKRFTLVYDPADPAAAGSQRLVYLPPSVKQDRGDYLPATTQMAIDYLSARSKKGFFLMVEGARIDKSEHSNDLPGTVWETLDFDKAIEVAVRFAERDGHTLVIISADHETGATILAKGDPAQGYVSGIFASKSHTPMMVPLFAYGPRSREFSGVQENSDVARKILQILGSKK
ncbi:MAG: alkaline phosphatase [Bacteroidales bacterium]|nr:alkaline phosphatase [Bacteroidales bacterium]